MCKYKCSKCGKIIPKKTRIYIGRKKGRYHIFCGSGLRTKSVSWI